MKYSLSGYLFILFFASSKIVLAQKTPMLLSNASFDPSILNYLKTQNVDESKITLIRIKSTFSGKTTAIAPPTFEIRVSMVKKESLKFLHLVKDTLYGYSIFENGSALIYGDNSVNYFFTKEVKNKSWACFSIGTAKSIKNEPPIILESYTYVFKYKNFQFHLVNEGLFSLVE